MSRAKVSKTPQKKRFKHSTTTTRPPNESGTEATGQASSSTNAAEAAHLANSNGKPPPAANLATALNADQAAKTHAAEVAEKIKELVRLAQEQGYLTYGDINDALPDALITPEDLDEIYIKLRNLDVEIVDQAEVDRIKQPEPDEDDEKTRLDILDDPVRMYLKQMGQVPLLTREQEVEISKRIENAENELKRIVHGFGFAGKEHIALAEKLVSEPPKERFDQNASIGSLSTKRSIPAMPTSRHCAAC
jgi:RNA polymerase primary sigma factor